MANYTIHAQSGVQMEVSWLYTARYDDNITSTCIKNVENYFQLQMHLFDIDIPGKIRFQESETLSPGNELTSFQMGNFCQVGVGICYDIRFSEMAQLYARNGAKINLENC